MKKLAFLILLFSSTAFSQNPMQVYDTAVTLGYQLAKTHAYYKGGTYIEQECTAFLIQTIGDTTTSETGRMFIKGCIDGYKQYWGK